MDDRSIMSGRLSINVSIAITFAALNPRTHARTHAQQLASPLNKRKNVSCTIFICIAIPLLRYKFIHLQFTVFIVWVLPNAPVSLTYSVTPLCSFAKCKSSSNSICGHISNILTPIKTRLFLSYVCVCVCVRACLLMVQHVSVVAMHTRRVVCYC